MTKHCNSVLARSIIKRSLKKVIWTFWTLVYSCRCICFLPFTKHCWKHEMSSSYYFIVVTGTVVMSSRYIHELIRVGIPVGSGLILTVLCSRLIPCEAKLIIYLNGNLWWDYVQIIGRLVMSCYPLNLWHDSQNNTHKNILIHDLLFHLCQNFPWKIMEWVVSLHLK